MRWLGFWGVVLACFSSACSAGLGGAGSYIVHAPTVPSAGLKATSLLDLAAFAGPSIAVGLDGELLSRTDHRDDFSQWRLRALLGIAHEPQPNDSFIGYEVLATPGMARIYGGAGTEAQLRGGAGLQLGAPLRLAAPRPIWRSDDLLGLGMYLVPTIGASWFYRNTLEFSAGITLRVNLWTAVLP